MFFRPSPIHAARPVEVITAASDRPPPNSRRMPHGTLLAVSQSIRNTRFSPSRPPGTRNSAMAPTMAIRVSSMAATYWDSSGWVTQAAAVQANTSATRFSPADQLPSSSSSWRSMARLSPSSLKPPRVSHHQVNSSTQTATGRPSNIHWPKPICTS